MKSVSRLKPILNIRQNTERRRASDFAHAASGQQERERKLGELRQYLKEYEDRQQAIRDPLLLANHHAFLERLRKAIRSQDEVVSKSRGLVELERQRWIGARRDRKVIDQLNACYCKAATRRAAAQAQDVLDECAQRLRLNVGMALR